MRERGALQSKKRDREGQLEDKEDLPLEIARKSRRTGLETELIGGKTIIRCIFTIS